MEPLNLNTLASSLQAGSSSSPTLQNAEQELLNNFKAAALSITTLYRSSRHTSERAYNAGYATACQDLLMMIQQGVSVSASPEGGMNIGRVMDWIEARLDAIKSREEEEDEDEEREKEKSKGMKPKSTPTATPLVMTRPPATVPTPAPSTGSQVNLTRPQQPPASTKPTTTTAPREPHFAFNVQSPPPVTMTELPSVTSGAKRRHAVMMMLDSANGEPSLLDTNGLSQRRRTRSNTRMVFGQQSQLQTESVTTAMDVEEEGRERKRPARR